MGATIQILDEEMTGAPLDHFSLEVPTDRMTVRELIRSRVHQQIKDRNLNCSKVFRGIVEPTEGEQLLNGEKPQKGELLDWKPFFEKAIEAYDQNRIIIIVDDRQTESLDEEIEVRSDTKVIFMRLMPLVGG